MGQRHIGKLTFANLLHDFTPKLARHKNVGLVDRKQFSGPTARHLKPDPRKAHDLSFCIFVEIIGPTTFTGIVDTAGGRKHGATAKFPDDHHV